MHDDGKRTGTSRTYRPARSYDRPMKLSHVNLVVADPEAAAAFYGRYILTAASAVWLGDSLHLRDATGSDLAFQVGAPLAGPPGPHHGFLADTPAAVDLVRDALARDGHTLTEDDSEPG